MIIGRHSKKNRKILKIPQRNQKYLAINSTTLIKIAIESVIFPNKLPTSTIMKTKVTL